MANEFSFSTFPSSKLEALAFLYLKNQDISQLSPEELLEKYNETYEKLREHNKTLRASKRQMSTY